MISNTPKASSRPTMCGGSTSLAGFRQALEVGQDRRTPAFSELLVEVLDRLAVEIVPAVMDQPDKGLAWSVVRKADVNRCLGSARNVPREVEPPGLVHRLDIAPGRSLGIVVRLLLGVLLHEEGGADLPTIVHGAKPLRQRRFSPH